MRSLTTVARRPRRVLAALCGFVLVAAMAAGCSGSRPPAPAASPPPRAAVAAPAAAERDPLVTLHWNDAEDTARVLEARPDQRLRVAVTITGIDTLIGYNLRFRLEPMTTPPGTAWKFADDGGCRAATWLFTAEPDPKAPAPWPNKLLITDLKAAPDGTVWMLVAAAWDKQLLDPDSTYLLCHLDFDPPTAAAEGGACAGWDGPARIYCESGELAITTTEFSLRRLGPAVTVRPVAAAKP
jgi:hypothetical protein